MSDDRMYDLIIRPLQNGGIELEQGCGSGESVLIDLHPCQLHYLAERAGLIPAPDPTLLDRLHVRHVARIRALAARIRELRDLYTDTILDHCADGIEICLHLDVIEGLACDLVEDIGAAPPAEPVTKKNETNTAISVTPTRKRGRPAKPDALTPAERQRAHRAKQGEPATAQQAALI